MNKIYQKRDFAEYYSLQVVNHVGLIDLISSPKGLCLISCPMSENTIFISVDNKAITCGFTG